MFRIRRIYDDSLPVNREALAQIQAIFAAQFPLARPADVANLADQMRDPLRAGFRTIIYIAENAVPRVLGFALILHDPQLNFCLLDYLATAKGVIGRGIGGTLYERVRQDALALGAKGLFLECLPDDPKDCPDMAVQKQNAKRLRFYERYGAATIVNTGYELPVRPGDQCMPHLLYDDLGWGQPLRRSFARQVVRAILERKYAYLCPKEYVEKVVRSIQDDPVQLRAPPPTASPPPPIVRRATALEPIALIINERHNIHHVRERGYVEAPVRIRSILAEIEPTRLFQPIPARKYADRHVLAVHDRNFVEYLRKVCLATPDGQSVYPYVFPVRNATRQPRDLSVRAGYYCIDTFTPLSRNAYLAARGAVNCALTGADEVLAGRPLAYALVRPPGHHAERRSFGGFCYFNNAAIAAHYLSAHGKVAILDIDYHHGNGQQQIFYERSDVLTVSIHGHPNIAYPYFTGFADEQGTGDGAGFNVNLPLPEVMEGIAFRKTLEKAIARVTHFNPSFLIVAVGFDTAKGDPTGSWLLSAKDFEQNGHMLGALQLPTLVVQEGGYRTRTLGSNARHFFQGLVAGTVGSRPRRTGTVAE